MMYDPLALCMSSVGQPLGEWQQCCSIWVSRMRLASIVCRVKHEGLGRAWSSGFLKEGIGVSVPQEKWDKTPQILTDLQAQVESCAELDHKQLERDRGFLVYIARMFMLMRSYLKVIHLTLDGWQEGRAPSGWKLPPQTRVGNVLEDMEVHFGIDEAKVPPRVKLGLQLRQDVAALMELCCTCAAPMCIVHPNKQIRVGYGFGDASGLGLGSSYTTSGGLLVRIGGWGQDAEDKSSNW